MNNKDLMNALTDIDADLLAHAEKTPSPVPLWVRVCAAAACLCLLIGTTLALIPNHSGDSPTVPSRIPAPLVNANIAPEKLTGSSLEFIVGNSAENSPGSPCVALPKFQFLTDGNFMVQAKVASVLPDIYYKLYDSASRKPIAYRLLRMQTLSVLSGEGIGDHFLYMIPEYLYVDMSAYDCLLISMCQVGLEGYMLRNSAQNEMEVFSEPVFGDQEYYRNSYQEFGHIIAFKNEIFDESLWQNPGWHYGYIFAQKYLDGQYGTDTVVQRGTTLEQALENIRAKIGDASPTIKTTQFTSPEAKAAYEYVKPFANGVFFQTYNYHGIVFRRYINGCPTDETVIIDPDDESVTYSDVRYTKDDLSSIEDISVPLSELARQYAEEPPIPPYAKPADQILWTSYLFALYTKVDGKVYGMIAAGWSYVDHQKDFTFAYRLYDGSAESGRLVSQNELLALSLSPVALRIVKPDEIVYIENGVIKEIYLKKD